MVYNPDKNNPARVHNNPQHNYNMQGVSIGTVQYVDSLRQVIIVTTVDNKKEEVPFAQAKGEAGEGFNFLPPSGKNWRAVLSNKEGSTIIEKFLPPNNILAEEDQLDKTTYSQGKKKDNDHSITGYENIFRSYTIRPKNTKQNYRANGYFDLIGGDWSYTTPERNGLNILRGGVNRLFANRLCQLYQFQQDDLTRIISRNYELFTDWGAHTVKNDKGKTTLSLKGNSGQNDKYSTWEETYEFVFELGSCAAGGRDKYFMTFEYKTKNDETFTSCIDKEGSFVLKSPKDVWLDVKEDAAITIGSHLGVFAGKEVLIDSGDKIKLKGGAQVQRNEDDTITTTSEGMAIEIGGSKVKLGKVDGVSLKPLQSVVRKDHLDKFNDLCGVVGDIILAMTTGDLGIPLPFGIRTGLMAKGFELKTISQDHTNYTDNTEAN